VKKEAITRLLERVREEVIKKESVSFALLTSKGG